MNFDKNTKIKVFLVGHQYHYLDFIDNKISLVKKIKDADLVFFTGGEDVNPYLYKETSHLTTYFNINRDKEEVLAFNEAQRCGVPCYGTCRGAQFLCVMSGGKLVQHMNHPGKHMLHMKNGDISVICLVNSLHHQLQYPFNLDKNDYDLIGWTEGLSSFNWTNANTNIGPMSKEPEVVFYKKTNSLGFQAHPEMLAANSLAVVTLNKLLLRLLNNELSREEQTI